MQEEERELSPLEFGAIVAVILGALIFLAVAIWSFAMWMNSSEPCVLSECNYE